MKVEYAAGILAVLLIVGLICFARMTISKRARIKYWRRHKEWEKTNKQKKKRKVKGGFYEWCDCHCLDAVAGMERGRQCVTVLIIMKKM